MSNPLRPLRSFLVGDGDEEAESVDLCDEIADMIADWYGRSVIDADRDLAQQIIDRVRGDDAATEHREPTYGWRIDERA